MSSPDPSPVAGDGTPVRNLGGLPIAVIDQAGASRRMLRAVTERRERRRAGDDAGRPFYSTSANGEVLCLAHGDPAVREDFLAADEILADGMPLVVASRWRGQPALPERVATTDLVHHLARDAAAHDASLFLLGASVEVNRRAGAALEAAHPGLTIAGSHHGYIGAGDEARVIEAINASGAEILLVAMGAPREQAFVCRIMPHLSSVAAIKTCGGLFDFLSGRRSRAPQWMQRASLEWLYRALLEPRRLGSRYLRTNGRAAWLLLTRSGTGGASS